MAKNIRNTRKQNLKRNQKNSTKTTIQNDTTIKDAENITILDTENNALLEIQEAEIKKAEEEKKEILQTINNNVAKAKNSCIGIVKDLKTIQVLAGVSTGASAVGTLTSGGALASGIVKSVKDKKIEENKKEIKKKQLQVQLNDELKNIERDIEEQQNRNDDFDKKRKENIEELALQRQRAIKEVPELYKQYNTKMKEYNSCKEDINKQLEANNEANNNNEGYIKLANRKDQLLEIAYQRYKKKYLDNKDPYIRDIQIHTEELSEEEKNEWLDIRSKLIAFEKNISISCDNLIEEAQILHDEIKRLDTTYINAGDKISELFGGNNYIRSTKTMRQYTYNGFGDASLSFTSNILNINSLHDHIYITEGFNLPGMTNKIVENSPTLTDSQIEKVKYPEETFTDVDSYINKYKNGNYTTGKAVLLSSSSYGNEFGLRNVEAIKEQRDLIQTEMIMTDTETLNTLKDRALTKKEIKELKQDNEKLNATSQTLGNLRTGLMAGSIATSTTSTITSGISAKKLDDLMEKMKDCDRSITTLKSSVNNAVAEKIDTDLSTYQNIVKSCSGFDTANIKEIKGVMVASAVVGGVGAVAGTVGTITSAVANNKKTKENAKSTEEGRLNAKALNITANISAGIATGTSASGIVLGAMTLNKLAKNVDVAEKCEDSLK
ncbi:hypothetical protein HDR59_03410 [bacterium]|nr:hypothetical protein [bacterium]